MYMISCHGQLNKVHKEPTVITLGAKKSSDTLFSDFSNGVLPMLEVS